MKQTANSCNLTLTIWFHGLLIGICCLIRGHGKCKVMSLGHSRLSIVSDYTMTQSDGKIVSVERSTLERDLGIMIDSGLKFSEQIHMASKKANSIIWQSFEELLYVSICNVSACYTSHYSETTP